MKWLTPNQNLAESINYLTIIIDESSYITQYDGIQWLNDGLDN